MTVEIIKNGETFGTYTVNASNAMDARKEGSRLAFRDGLRMSGGELSYKVNGKPSFFGEK